MLRKGKSATAEYLAREYRPQHEYGSAGTNRKICFQLGNQYIEKEQLIWADLVFAMENKHKKELLKLFGSQFGRKIKVLGIRDYYEFGNAELKEILKEKLQAYL